MFVDLREDGRWDEIPTRLRGLLDFMNHSWPQDDSDESWEKFESTPITLGFGDHVLLLPTCAASYNFLSYCLEEMADEFEA